MIEELKQLSEIERKVLCFITNEKKSLIEIEKESKVPIDSVRRAGAWLAEKGFAIINEQDFDSVNLTSEGKKVLDEGLPENIMLKTLTRLGGSASFNELQKESGLSGNAFTAALGINKRKAFIIISQGEIQETGVASEQEEFDDRNLLRDIVDGKNISSDKIEELLKRGLVEKSSSVKRTIVITKKGIDAKSLLAENKIERVYDVNSPVPKIFMGKKAPYIQFLKQIREKLVGLGFNEMYSPLIVSEFYNFDVLFQPQNHPARTSTDSYLLSKPTKGILPDKKIVNAIKAAHENGGVAKSTGWGYKWDPMVAARLVPAMQGTAHSAKQLVSGVKSPNKYFAIARCFRPDVLDATHLLEFNQMEGFIVGDDLNFKHLLGMLKEFAIEVAGAEKVKFFPDYYPFTEPSVQLSAKHPEMGWVEFAGAGMFRPEMLENLGIKGQAIAWGMGIDRLAMFKLGIKDIRYLFAEDLAYLRKAKGVLI
jgi:phenylalanyl-tRNA synthetase alpha chain